MAEKKSPICKNCEFYVPFDFFIPAYCRLAYKKTSAHSSCKDFKLLKWYVQGGYEVGEEEAEK
jgi:hypothetical protein